MTTRRGPWALALLVLAAAVLTPRPALAAPADVLSVVITAPMDDSIVSGRVSITAEASHETTQIDFSVSTDGGTTWAGLGSDATPADGWSATWSSDGYSGNALIRAIASDGMSQASDEVSVTVDNSPPQVSLQISRRVFSPNGTAEKMSPCSQRHRTNLQTPSRSSTKKGR